MFLSTEARRALLEGLPVRPVPVLSAGAAPKALAPLVRPALFKSPDWRAALAAQAAAEKLDVARAAAETEASDLAEGLYLKRERDGMVEARAKFVRSDFLQAVAASRQPLAFPPDPAKWSRPGRRPVRPALGRRRL